MNGKAILILADAALTEAVSAMLAGSRDGPFSLECLGRCSEGVERLQSPRGDDIAAVVADLALTDCRGLETFTRLSAAAPDVPILVIGEVTDEDVARQAVRHGAQDYLLKEDLDGRSLSKALSIMLERSTLSQALRRASQRAELTLDSIGDAVVSMDVAGNVAYLNPVAEHMTGWSQQEACGRPLQEVLRIVDAATREPVPDPLALAIMQDRTVGLSADCVLVHRNGHESAIEDTAAPIHDARGRVIGAVIVFHDVSAARAMSLRMSFLAQHDPLTGLPNRVLLRDRLALATEAARRHRKALAVLFVDVDRFKYFNDAYGHAVGDNILQSIARRLVGCVRGSDTVSRQGGDEFVVLLPDVDSAEAVGFIAEKVLAAMSIPHRIEHQDLQVTVSVGIGMYPGDGADAETLLRKADAALLYAKAHGRGHYHFFEPHMTPGGPAMVPKITRLRSNRSGNLRSTQPEA